MAFKFIEPNDVRPLIKGKLSGWREEFLDAQIELLSARLNAWYPTLRRHWEESDEDSTLRGLIRAMMVEAAKKLVNNPEMMSSETAGPYAYSRFDSEDPYKQMFMPRDLEALEDLLDAERNKQAGHVQMGLPFSRAKPMPRPRRYAAGRKWKRY